MPGKRGLLLSKDLFFTTRIQGVATALGCAFEVVSERVRAWEWIAAHGPALVLLDLTAGDLVSPDAVSEYRARAGANTWFVAFGSHLDREALAGARSSGCQQVMPRSRFTTELPGLINRYLGGQTGPSGVDQSQGSDDEPGAT